MLEVKIDPIWKAVTEIIPKALMQDRTPELDVLLGKAINGYSSMTAEEKHRLNFLLDCEFIWALENGDLTRVKRITIYQASLNSIGPRARKPGRRRACVRL